LIVNGKGGRGRGNCTHATTTAPRATAPTIPTTVVYLPLSCAVDFVDDLKLRKSIGEARVTRRRGEMRAPSETRRGGISGWWVSEYWRKVKLG